MHRIFLTAFIFLVAALPVIAQPKSNEAMSRQITARRAEKTITLTFDKAGNTSKLMAISEDFSDSKTGNSRIMAMNFAAGFFYPGDKLDRVPDPIQFSFWVLSKKPRFGAGQHLSVFVDGETLDLGNARYIAKPRMNMEYLNFDISRANLARMASRLDVRFRLGDAEFTFTRSQMKLIADLLAISDFARQ